MATTRCAAELEIRHGRLSARVRPDVGGSVSAFDCEHRGRRAAVLRPAPRDATSPLQMASFPLVPFCNRIENGTFAWEGRTVRLPPNHPGDRFPLHGYGWYATWLVRGAGETYVELEWESAHGDWPWAFQARQRIELHDGELRVGLCVTNRSPGAMPAGLGHHPYFPRSATTRLRAHLPYLWAPDERLIPSARVPNPLAAEFARGCALDRLRVDAGFTGWDGRALIEQPDAGLGIELGAEPGQAFHLYVPDAPVFCAEAVQNQPNALNEPRADVPMSSLAPGATLAYELRLRVGALEYG